MPLSNAARHKRYRARLKAQQPRGRYRRPQQRRSRLQRWGEAGETLRALQAEYHDWRDHLPASQQGSTLAETLEDVCALDLNALDLDLSRGFGRD